MYKDTYFICFLSASPPEENRVLHRAFLLPESGSEERPGRGKIKTCPVRAC